MDINNISVMEMETFVARFSELTGSDEAFVDSRLPGHKRFKINLVGMGVVEATDKPELHPNIPLPAKGFNLGMIQAENGNGAALHAHETEEVFMPLIGPWEVYWAIEEGDNSITLEPFDSISVPMGVYRGFRYVGEGQGTLLTIIGGPDAGRVDWHPTITEAASESGLERTEAGDLKAST
ncbi:MAG: cupin [Alphaproteobacteria bacterium]|nr:cupin [Alphaproteobacteria bacterium]HCP00445.1 cupin domain-containing protein [Rhodospirillaceae bacterium]